jgi:hypothetical protein
LSKSAESKNNICLSSVHYEREIMANFGRSSGSVGRASGIAIAPGASFAGLKAGAKFSGGKESIRVGGVERGLGGGTITFSNRNLAEFSRPAGPSLTFDRGRTSTGLFAGAESGRPVHTVTSGTGLQPRTDSSLPLDKRASVIPKRGRNLPSNFGAYEQSEVFTSRREIANTRVENTPSFTRQFPVEEPNRQSIENGGSTRNISQDQLRSLLRQDTSTGRPERNLIGSPQQRRESVTILPDINSYPINPTRFAPRAGDQPGPVEIARDISSQKERQIEAVRVELGRFSVTRIPGTDVPQPDVRQIVSSPPVIDAVQKVLDVSTIETNKNQTSGEKAQDELKIRETKRAIMQGKIYLAEEIAVETTKEEEKKKSLRLRIQEEIKILRQRLTRPSEDQLTALKTRIQPAPDLDEVQMLLIQPQSDLASQLKQKTTEVDTRTQKRAHLYAVSSGSVSSQPEILLPQATDISEQVKPPAGTEIDVDVASSDLQENEDLKHVIAKQAERASLRLGTEAINNVKANENDEISGVSVAELILLKRRGDEKSPIVGEEEDGAFIRRLQIIAKIILATKTIMSFYYNELVHRHPPVTVAKQGKNVTYEQVRLVTHGPKEFDAKQEAA